MTRRSKTHGVAGSCCCLVPVLILLAMIVLAVIGAAFVLHGVRPGFFPLGLRYHHSEAYRDGYQEGNRLGAAYAPRGDPEPMGRDLDALALREADRLHIKRDRGQRLPQWFRAGLCKR
jgi:hypothetical protein